MASTQPVAKFISIFVIAILLVVEGCSYLANKSSPASEATAKADQERALMEANRRLDQDFLALGPIKASELLVECRNKIRSQVDELKPFSGFIVDREASTDVHLAAASAVTLRPMATRVSEIAAMVKDQDSNARVAFEFASAFTVIETKDTFDGPKRVAFVYSCKFEPGLALRVVKRQA